MDIQEYLDEQERSPFSIWFNALDVQAAAKVSTALTRLSLGNTSNTKDVGSGILELKIDFGKGYRIYFGKDGEQLLISANKAKSHQPSCAGKTTSCERKVNIKMALTRDFKETIQARANRDPKFRDALLTEGVEALLTGEVDLGKAILRDYINATMGFGPLAEATGSQPKSLMRMLGPSGNPTAKNLMAIIGYLQRERGLSLQVRAG